MFKSCSIEIKERLIITLQRYLSQIARSIEGTLAVQSMMENSTESMNLCKLFIEALAPDCLNLVRSQQGSYCLQKAFDKFPFSLMSPICAPILLDISSSSSSLLFEATDFWCMTYRVIMDVSCFGTRVSLTDEIIRNARDLSRGEYGHLVVLHVLVS